MNFIDLRVHVTSVVCLNGLLGKGNCEISTKRRGGKKARSGITARQIDENESWRFTDSTSSYISCFYGGSSLTHQWRHPLNDSNAALRSTSSSRQRNRHLETKLPTFIDWSRMIRCLTPLWSLKMGPWRVLPKCMWEQPGS